MLRVIQIFILTIVVFANGFQNENARKIESLILSEISTVLLGKAKIKVFLTDNMKYILKYSKILIPVQTCREAELVIAGEKIKTDDCRGKLMVVTKYYLIKQYNEAVAAFYWHKGRPNIIFIYERLKKFDIKLPDRYYKYIDSEKNL